jgi:hypothetical protein
MGILKFLCVLVVVAICLFSHGVVALFEEQAGEFDWSMENIGKISKSIFSVRFLC